MKSFLFVIIFIGLIFFGTWYILNESAKQREKYYAEWARTKGIIYFPWEKAGGK